MLIAWLVLSTAREVPSAKADNRVPTFDLARPRDGDLEFAKAVDID